MANSLNKITTKSILDATVATADIADDAVTADKLANAINTDIAAKAVLTGSTNNTITTVTGANAIQGEANLTYDGTNLQAKQTGDTAQDFIFDSNRSAANNVLGRISGYWDTDRVADITLRSGSDTTNKDDGEIAFRTSTEQGAIAERMRIKSGGEVAIGGTGYAGQPFSLQTSGVNLGWMESTGTTRAVMNFSDANSTVGVGYGAIGNNHVFLKDAAEKVRIQSGGGISFNGDTAAANALDDYEEGSWTPINASGQAVDTIANDGAWAIGAQGAKYTKIGNTVHFSADTITIPSTGGQYTFILGGLPFTNIAINTGLNNVISTDDGCNEGLVVQGANYIYFYNTNSTTANKNTHLSGAVMYGISGTYTTAS